MRRPGTQTFFIILTVHMDIAYFSDLANNNRNLYCFFRGAIYPRACKWLKKVIKKKRLMATWQLKHSVSKSGISWYLCCSFMPLLDSSPKLEALRVFKWLKNGFLPFSVRKYCPKTLPCMGAKNKKKLPAL